MKDINQGLLKELQKKLDVSERTVYRRIKKKVTKTQLDPHLAAIALGMEYGITKYSTSEDLAVIRGSKTQPVTPIVVAPPEPRKKKVEAGEPLNLDLSFISSSDLRKILKRDIAELNVAISQGYNKTSKTCMVLAGSIVEALLLDVLKKNETAAKSVASQLPNKPNSNLDKWVLSDMVSVGMAMSPPLLPADAESGASQLRQWRNLIHPGRELRDAKNKRISPTPGRARTAVSFLQFIADELSTI